MTYVTLHYKGTVMMLLQQQTCMNTTLKMEMIQLCHIYLKAHVGIYYLSSDLVHW